MRKRDVIRPTRPALSAASKISTTNTATAAPANQIGTARVPAAASTPGITGPLFRVWYRRAPTGSAHYAAPGACHQLRNHTLETPADAFAKTAYTPGAPRVCVAAPFILHACSRSEHRASSAPRRIKLRVDSRGRR